MRAALDGSFAMAADNDLEQQWVAAVDTVVRRQQDVAKPSWHIAPRTSLADTVAAFKATATSDADAAAIYERARQTFTNVTLEGVTVTASFGTDEPERAVRDTALFGMLRHHTLSTKALCGLFGTHALAGIRADDVAEPSRVLDFPVNGYRRMIEVGGPKVRMHLNGYTCVVDPAEFAELGFVRVPYWHADERIDVYEWTELE